jgi:phage gp36-like protein
MPYATQQDILDRHGADALLIATDRDNDGTVDTDAVDRALDDATAEINVYLGKVEVLPLVTVPAVLVQVCVDIALYKASTGLAMTEEKRQRYEDAIALLKSVATGAVSLGIDDGSAEPAAGGDVEIIGPGRQFSRSTMNVLT